MQLASQCLRHLNRACLDWWQPRQGLTATRRAISSIPRTLPKDLRGSIAPLLAAAAAAERHVFPLFQGSASYTILVDDVAKRPKSNAKAAAEPRPSLGPLRPQRDSREMRIANLGIWGDFKSDNEQNSEEKIRQLRELDIGLIDTSQNENNASIWLGRLQTAKREYGQDGVLAVWDALERRKTLYEVGSNEAELFWKTILEAVIHEQNQLQRAILYADWMFQVHAVRWPSLYTTTVSYCLRNGQNRRAMQLHLRLMPKFDPGPEAFGAVLRESVKRPDTDLQETLRSLYVTTLHHSLYDEIIPFLYQSGLSQLCEEWRHLFIQYKDLPGPTVKSQPYLMFLDRYHPGTSLVPEEQLVLDLNSSSYWDVKRESLLDAMNSVHTDEPDAAGRIYSDTLGARWFASSWVPLDFAIHAVYALGVHQIGPLSLQSIALREPEPEAVLARIKQLQKLNISIGHTTYAQAVRHFAENGDGELLSELLHTDIHPDVFDDPVLQQRIRDKALETRAWKTYRLLVATQPAVAQESIESMSNTLLQQHLNQRQLRQAIALIDDMRSMDIDMNAASVQCVFSYILEPLPCKPKVEPNSWENLRTAINFLDRLVLFQKPVPSRYWQKVFYGLGKFGRFQELEALCLGVVDAYRARCASQGGLSLVHHEDAPPSRYGGLADDIYVPADLPMTHDHHPMRKIFDSPTLQASIARWGFKAGISRDPVSWAGDSSKAQDGSGLGVARGVRLLSMLHERGVQFRTRAVQEEVTKHLVKLYRWQGRMGSHVFKSLPDLQDVIDSINEAARPGARRSILPSIIIIRDRIAVAAEEDDGRESYLDTRTKRRKCAT